MSLKLFGNHDYPKTFQELEQKYRSKQENWTRDDTEKCLADYYRLYPNAKKTTAGEIKLPPPCPGVPQ